MGVGSDKNDIYTNYIAPLYNAKRFCWFSGVLNAVKNVNTTIAKALIAAVSRKIGKLLR